MKKVFISVPMSGRKNEDIAKDIVEAMEAVKNSSFFKGEEIEFVHNLHCKLPSDYEINGMKKTSLWYLGEAIKSLSYCDACYFVPGWDKSSGCFIECEICLAYDVDRYTIDQNNVVVKSDISGGRAEL